MPSAQDSRSSRVFDVFTMLAYLAAAVTWRLCREWLTLDHARLLIPVSRMIFMAGMFGLWLHFRRRGPGLEWFLVSLIGAVLFLGMLPEGLAWEFSVGPSIGDGASRFQAFLSLNGLLVSFGLAAVLKRHYHLSWLLIVVALLEALFLPLISQLLSSAVRQVLHSESFWQADLLIYLVQWLLKAIPLGFIIARPRQSWPGWSSVEQSLKRCRPLEDPLLALHSVGFWSVVISLLSALIIVIIAGVRGENSEQVVSIIAQGLISAGPVLVLGVLLLVLTPGPMGGPNAFIVRAFRRDDETSRLRDLLAVALGPQGRLLGIRSPSRRFGWFTRIFALMEGAFRYMGGNHCDLEAADGNWLARVLATLRFRNVEFVVIDLREITSAVTVEVQVVVRAITPQRCVWLLDASRTRDEWLQEIRALSSGTTDAVSTSHLLNVSEAMNPASRAVQDLVQQLLTQPKVTAEEQQRAEAEAHDLARSHVPASAWQTGWLSTYSGTFWLGGLLIIPLMRAVTNIGPLFPTVSYLILGLWALFILVVGVRTLISAGAALGRQMRLASLGRSLAPERGWSVWHMMKPVMPMIVLLLMLTFAVFASLFALGMSMHL